ncbi:MAG: hypothetical protein KDM81_13730, partial [Verrucomicrobiae bacterium]|nr:hypothetical protein [Verrucomicrobiae bacterium]
SVAASQASALPRAADRASRRRLALVGALLAMLAVAAGITLWLTKPWVRMGRSASEVPAAGQPALVAGGEQPPSAPPSRPPGDAEAGAVRRVVDAFVRALTKEDLAAAQAEVTASAKPDAVKNFLAFVREAGGFDDSTRFAMREPQVRGDSAEVTVDVTMTDDSGAMRFDVRRENGSEWRIRKVYLEEGDNAEPGAASMSLPIDFTADANPMQSLLEAMSGAMARAFGEGGAPMMGDATSGYTGGSRAGNAPWDLEAITPLVASWQVDFAQQPPEARGIIDAQLETLGLRPGPSVFTATGGRTVVLPGRRGTPLELIEEVGRQIGWVPQYSSGQLTFERGERKEPVAFAGPFMLRIVRVKPPAADGTAGLTLELVGVGLPEGLRRRWEDTGLSFDHFRIEASDGMDLHDFGRLRDFDVAIRRPGDALLTHQEEVGLRRVGAGVDRIALLQADLYLPLPPALSRSLALEELTPGTRVSGHGVDVTLEAARLGDTASSLRLAVKGFEVRSLGLLATDAAGNRLDVPGRMWQGEGGTQTVTFEIQGKVAAATLLLDSDGARQRFEFVFREVPLRAGSPAGGGAGAGG